jgi:hypothetical protein
MPCKQARRDVSGDGHETVSISKQRSVRAVTEAKNPDMDGRETRYNLRLRRCCRSETSGPFRNVSGSFGP